MLNFAQFRESVRFIVDGDPNPEWGIPTLALLSRLKRRLKVNTYQVSHIERDAELVRTMLSSDSPFHTLDRGLLTHILGILDEHLNFLYMVDAVLDDAISL